MDKKVRWRIGAVLLAVAFVGLGAGYGGYRLAASWQHARDDEEIVHWVRDRRAVLSDVLVAWQMAQQRAVSSQQPPPPQPSPNASVAPPPSPPPPPPPSKPGGK